MRELRFHINVFRGFIVNTFARESDYRGNLIAEIIDSLLNIFVNIYFFKIIFLNTNAIAGWNSEEMLVLVAVTQIITSIIYMLFMNNLPRIQRYVLRGDFDYILLKPGSLTANYSLYKPQPLIKTGFQSYFFVNSYVIFCSYL